MEEKKFISKLSLFEELTRQMGIAVFAIDGLKMFVNHCKDGKKVHINNPVDCNGNFDVDPQRFLPIVEEELERKRKDAQDIAKQIKALLDGDDFENWNKVEETTN